MICELSFNILDTLCKVILLYGLAYRDSGSGLCFQAEKEEELY